MPEGPELHMTSKFINNVCQGRIFGKVTKSDINKNPLVTPAFDKFTISASSRGKELKLVLTQAENANEKLDKKTSQPDRLDILVTFGLAGKFEFLDATDLEKHSHLNFFTVDQGPPKALSFVDYMRFGKWNPGTDFSFKDRGPCPLTEYEPFRQHVLDNLHQSAFNKPICEVLLNQKYFNGIGNYLRAEILYRAKIPPFMCARSVLEPLTQTVPGVKLEAPDILQLCCLLQEQVVQLEGSWYTGARNGDSDKVSNGFNDWLQCYYQDGMKNTVDHNKRTIWYAGPLGPMAPRDIKVRAKKTSKKREKSTGNSSEEKDQDASKAKSRKRGQPSAPGTDGRDDIKPKKTKTENPKKSPKRKERRKQNGGVPANNSRQNNIIDSVVDDQVLVSYEYPVTRRRLKAIVGQIDSLVERKKSAKTVHPDHVTSIGTKHPESASKNGLTSKAAAGHGGNLTKQNNLNKKTMVDECCEDSRRLPNKSGKIRVRTLKTTNADSKRRSSVS